MQVGLIIGANEVVRSADSFTALGSEGLPSPFTWPRLARLTKVLRSGFLSDTLPLSRARNISTLLSLLLGEKRMNACSPSRRRRVWAGESRFTAGSRLNGH